MILTQEELLSAVHEWCENRNIPSKGKKIQFFSTLSKGEFNYRFSAQIEDVAMPLKEGPYR